MHSSLNNNGMSVSQPRKQRRRIRLHDSLQHLQFKGYCDAITDRGVLCGIPFSLVAQLTSISCSVVGKSVITDAVLVHLLSHATAGRLKTFELIGSVAQGDFACLERHIREHIMLTLAQLDTLNLSGSRITDDNCRVWMATFPSSLSWNVRKLILSGCDGITSTGVGLLMQHCEHVETLTLANCDSVSDTFFTLEEVVVHSERHLISSRQLGYVGVTELSLSGCLYLSDAALAHISARCVNLLRLNLSMCETISDSGVIELQRNCSTIRELNLYGCRRITDRGIASIANLTMLEELNLGNCRLISDASIHSLASHLPLLRGLNLFQCTQLSNEALKLLSAFRDMRVLSMAMCTALTDVIVVEIVAAMPMLRFLSLDNCSKLTDATLQQLPLLHHGLHHLRELYLSCCSQLTVAGVKSLRSMGALTTLDVSMCRKIVVASDSDISEVKQMLSHVAEFNL